MADRNDGDLQRKVAIESARQVLEETLELTKRRLDAMNSKAEEQAQTVFMVFDAAFDQPAAVHVKDESGDVFLEMGAVEGREYLRRRQLRREWQAVKLNERLTELKQELASLK